MHKPTIAGAAALVAAPALALAGIAVTPTLSDHAADQVTALTVHHSGMIIGLTLQTLAVCLLIAGTAWLALVVSKQAPRLALAGGTLGIAGFLVVLFENGAAAASSTMVGGLDQATATRLLDHIHSSALAGLEPLSLLGDLGLALLAVGAAKAGAAQWTPVAITVGAIGTAAGFAIGNKPLLLLTFAVLLVGLAGATANLVASPVGRARQEQVIVPAG
jgi:hypothetical protein